MRCVGGANKQTDSHVRQHNALPFFFRACVIFYCFTNPKHHKKQGAQCSTVSGVRGFDTSITYTFLLFSPMLTNYLMVIQPNNQLTGKPQADNKCGAGGCPPPLESWGGFRETSRPPQEVQENKPGITPHLNSPRWTPELPQGAIKIPTDQQKLLQFVPPIYPYRPISLPKE